MRFSESTTGTNTVEVSGLVRLYSTTLKDRGYESSALRSYVRAVEHFIAWATPKAGRVEIGEVSIGRFLQEHLHGCDCADRRQLGRITARAALNHLVAMLRVNGLLVPAVSTLPDHIYAELEAYGVYAIEVCGLAQATIISRRKWIDRFLSYHFPSRGLNVSKLEPKSIRNFFVHQCRDYLPGSVQVVASAIRNYLRFRSVRHADSVEALIAAVPGAARWRLAPLPPHLGPSQLTTLMSAFDRKRPQSQRDYAIVRCLVDLGLRSCEVAALQLDDFDWTSGTLTIRSGKAHRADVLPLPAITGAAIADYLRNARSAEGTRAVFVRHRAPLDLPINASVVRSVVRLAAARSGLSKQLRGPHLLRHSAATRMLHGGATLKEIADILRHRSLDTTAIYAKVDIARLSAIAQPWPGGEA